MVSDVVEFMALARTFNVSLRALPIPPQDRTALSLALIVRANLRHLAPIPAATPLRLRGTWLWKSYRLKGWYATQDPGPSRHSSGQHSQKASMPIAGSKPTKTVCPQLSWANSVYNSVYFKILISSLQAIKKETYAKDQPDIWLLGLCIRL